MIAPLLALERKIRQEVSAWVVKERSGSRLIAVQTQVVNGDPQEVRALLGEHTASVERTHLTSRQMNGRLARKSLSYAKRLRLLSRCQAPLFLWKNELL